MTEPQEPLNAKHTLFSICLLACLLVGLLSVIFSISAASKSDFMSAGVCLIPGVLSFGSVMFSCLALIKQ